jgi:hypothetical protein
VAGRNLVASETGTWLAEHFTETLADVKYLLDDLYLSGVNHIVFHGTCYSPDEAPWPGWLFYASTEMNPRNSIWRDVPALAAYITRCQSVLQSGRSDNDLLLYWPIHDRWHSAKGMVQPFTVHARDWFEAMPVGKAAEHLWSRGFLFDYVSDRQLAAARVQGGLVQTAGGGFRAVLVPPCEHIPLPTVQKLVELARAGATVVFAQDLPKDVPGLADLDQRRHALGKLLATPVFKEMHEDALKEAALGQGRLLLGDIDLAMARAGIARESLVDFPGLMVVRRQFEGGRHYFIANRGQAAVEGWIPLAVNARSVVIMDPLAGRTSLGQTREVERGGIEVYLRLRAGDSIILRAFADQPVSGDAWTWLEPDRMPQPVAGEWSVQFVQGGPVLPPDCKTSRLASWTDFAGEEAVRFAGTARYTLRFDAAGVAASRWLLDLGKVCQSARVRLNGRELGTLFIPPFQVEAVGLKAKDNLLEVEVTSVSANRIRDLDQRKVNWKTFQDINIVNLNYRPFDASNWPITESGLLGPVRLLRAKAAEPPKQAGESTVR